MLDFRSVDHSLRQEVEGLFTSPTADLPGAWAVYDEDSFVDDNLIPDPPFVFLLESKARPRISRLPMIVLERAPVTWLPFEIGNEQGSEFAYSIHIFARNRGERSDLAAYLYKNLTRVRLYDFSTEPATLEYAATVMGKFSQTNSVSPDVGMEGSLNNWESIGISFQTKSP